MKRIAFAVGLVVLVFEVALSAQTAVQKVGAKGWTPRQLDALNAFDKYIAASIKGNLDEVMAFFHPNFVGWDYGQELPANYLAQKKMMEEFYKTSKLSKFMVDPLEIQVENNFAVLHLKYEETFSDSTGKQTTGHGPWTVVMLKRGNRWVLLSVCWLEQFKEGK